MRKFSTKIRNAEADVTVYNDQPGNPPTHIWFAINAALYPQRAVIAVCGISGSIREFVKRANTPRHRLQYQRVMVARVPNRIGTPAVNSDPTPEQIAEAHTEDMSEIGICSVGTWPIEQGASIALLFDQDATDVTDPVTHWLGVFNDISQGPNTGHQRYTPEADEYMTWAHLYLEQVIDALGLRDPK